MATRPGQRWFRLRLDKGRGPQWWDVRLVGDHDTPEIHGNCGVCLLTTRTILVDPTAHEGADVGSTVLHELLHAAWPGPATRERDPEEERIVAALEARLWPVLAAHGLRWPERKG